MALRQRLKETFGFLHVKSGAVTQWSKCTNPVSRIDSGLTFVGSNRGPSSFPFCHPTTLAPCGASSNTTTSDDATPTVRP